MKTELYTIETLTNLHVGAGDINLGVVDNQVQRDAITELPNIHSSSLKGAFREHFDSKDNSKILVNYIFGSDNSSTDTQAGAYNFFEAQLLTRPVRSDKRAYFNATSQQAIKNLLEAIDSFGIEFDKDLKDGLKDLLKIKVEDNKPLIFEDIDAILEDEKSKYQKFDSSKLKDLLGDDLALFSDRDFKDLELPVIARNQLDDGVSKNLWYEEVVPKKSKFFFFIGKPDNIDPKDNDQKIKGFENRFTKEGEIVQIGANKSIGYGFCKIKKASK